MKIKVDKIVLAENVRRLRLMKNISPEELAVLAKNYSGLVIRASWIMQVEKGVSQSVEKLWLEAVAGAFGVPLEALLAEQKKDGIENKELIIKYSLEPGEILSPEDEQTARRIMESVVQNLKKRRINQARQGEAHEKNKNEDQKD